VIECSTATRLGAAGAASRTVQGAALAPKQPSFVDSNAAAFQRVVQAPVTAPATTTTNHEVLAPAPAAQAPP
jgi:hypothetical protein